MVSLAELKIARKEVEKTSGELEPATQNMIVPREIRGISLSILPNIIERFAPT